ncbi:microfibril-associated glycoprotein 4-like [Salarias fasciatus]|uniref:microfibril-associated glycoprotein 4-like n=1 Tax=Salarias fasciatus TaxID=181472 RepID=UPI00117671DE|nr:microfibril-associated glycoprotein 4-like [Salarias fasciatus]
MQLSALLSFLLLLLPLMTTCFPKTRPRSCDEVEQYVSLPSNVYTIYPTIYGDPVKVFCDFDIDRGRWTVLLKRSTGDLNFYRPWESYRNGFGDPAEEYWLGLETLYHLTKDGSYELLVVLEDFDRRRVYAHYNSFYIDSVCEGYKLHVSGFRDGGAGDSLTYHDGQSFSTFDKDQDSSDTNCAQRFLGGFWFKSCYQTNPTGIYQWGRAFGRFSTGIVWSKWRGFSYSVKCITFMFRPS